MPYAKHLLTSLYQYLNTYKEITAKSQSLVISTLIYLKLMIMLYFVTILTQFCPRVSSQKMSLPTRLSDRSYTHPDRQLVGQGIEWFLTINSWYFDKSYIRSPTILIFLDYLKPKRTVPSTFIKLQTWNDECIRKFQTKFNNASI